MFDFFAELVKDAPPGTCIFCERRLHKSAGRPRVVCGAAVCKREYHRNYKAWQRESEATPPRPPEPCRQCRIEIVNPTRYTPHPLCRTCKGVNIQKGKRNANLEEKVRALRLQEVREEICKTRTRTDSQEGHVDGRAARTA